ncbi:MAG: cytochrome C [Geobacter sp.]|nr:cytochrome C [Geobacter sp.]
MDEVSVDRGRELFSSPELGKSGKSCFSCHPGGKKLEMAAASENDERLTGMINNCIVQVLKGKALAPDTVEMQSLLMYIRTFGGPGR